MKFLKYHGTGNDFIIPLDEGVNQADLPYLARTLCHRQFGFGADGLLAAFPSVRADVRMAYFNQDGSQAPMCGNGLRCFARFVHEQGLIQKDVFRVETLAGVLSADVKEGYDRIRVEVGRPHYNLTSPHTAQPVHEGDPLKLTVNGRSYEMTVLFLGTLHGVIFTKEEVPEEDARALCHHEIFPARINVNFVDVQDEGHLAVTTYERGVGYTLACGTGAAAAQTLAHKKGYTKEEARIKVPGGTLAAAAGSKVYLQGPAVFIGKGEMEIG